MSALEQPMPRMSAIGRERTSKVAHDLARAENLLTDEQDEFGVIRGQLVLIVDHASSVEPGRECVQVVERIAQRSGRLIFGHLAKLCRPRSGNAPTPCARHVATARPQGAAIGPS